MPSDPDSTPCLTGDDCGGAMSDLHAYIDGWADEVRASELRGHLEGCDSCDEVFSFHEKLQKLVSSECQSELPSELKDRILNAIECCDLET